MELAAEYAGFVRTKTANNEAQNPGLGYSVAYDSSSRGQATIYVYNRRISGIPDGPMSSTVRQEYESAITSVSEVEEALGAKVELADKYGTGTLETGPEFLCAEFVLRDATATRRSFLYVTAAAGNFVKLRVTLAGNDPTDSTARRFADAVAADLPKVHFYALGKVENAKLGWDGRIEVLDLVSIALPGPWSWYAEDMNDPGAKGTIFRCYDNQRESTEREGEVTRELAHILAADLSDDPDEPDVTLFAPEAVTDFDRFLEAEVRKQMARDGREMVKWMSSHLNETPNLKGLVTAYIARDQGKERQYIDLRTTVRGKRVVVEGCFDVERASERAAPIFSTLQDVELVQPPLSGSC